MFLTTWLAVFFLHYVQIAAFRDGDVRLVNSNRYGTGRLEVFYEGSWGTVCQRGWDLDDTEVICRQLGFPKGAQRFFPGGQFGEGDGRVLLSDVNCIGVESNLLECGNVQGNWASNDCQHGSDVGLQCSAPNFEGCFSTRLLLAIDGITVNGMTLEDCFEFCGKHQYTWVHDGTNCGCGNEIDGAVLVNQEECSINCPGNSDQICGGTDSASIYKVEVDLPYVASPGFPGRYATTDDVVPIVRNFAPQEVTGYSYIRFHQFELPSTATLLVFSNDRNLTIQGDTDVTEYWISSANNPFQISFLPPPGNTGSLGFLIEFGEGSYCPSTTSVSNGRISTTASMPYTVGTQLRVICDLGFIAYDDEVFCQADGRFNREIRCDSIISATTTPSTTAAATTRTATTTQQPQTVGDNSRTNRPLIPNVTLPGFGCSVPNVDNGRVNATPGREILNTGDVLEVTCNPAYEAVESTVTCQRNGTLTSTPECRFNQVLLIIVIAVAAVVFILFVILVFILICCSCYFSRKKRRRVSSYDRRNQRTTNDEDFRGPYGGPPRLEDDNLSDTILALPGEAVNLNTYTPPSPPESSNSRSSDGGSGGRAEASNIDGVSLSGTAEQDAKQSLDNVVDDMERDTLYGKVMRPTITASGGFGGHFSRS